MYTSRAGEKCRSVHEFWIAHLKYKWLSEPCHEAAEHYFIKHILPCEIRRQRIYWPCFSCKISFACIFLLNLINYRGFKIVLWMLASKKVVLKRIQLSLVSCEENRLLDILLYCDQKRNNYSSLWILFHFSSVPSSELGRF